MIKKWAAESDYLGLNPDSKCQFSPSQNEGITVTTSQDCMRKNQINHILKCYTGSGRTIHLGILFVT